MKNTNRNSLFSYASRFFSSEAQCLLDDTLNSIYDYEENFLSVNVLAQTIEKTKQDKNLICLDVVTPPITFYVNSLFLIVHAAFKTDSRPDIPDAYFSLMNIIENFLVLVYKKHSKQLNKEIHNDAIKIILLFNTWGKVLESNTESNRFGAFYENLGREYFNKIGSLKKTTSYEEFLSSSYKNCANTTRKKFLRDAFIQLSREYNKLTSIDGGVVKNNDFWFFNQETGNELSEAQPLIKQKTT